MKWQRTESRQRRSDALVDFAAKPTTRSATNLSFKRPVKICSPSFTRTETALLTTRGGSTTWRSIWAGSPGPSSQNEHGQKSEAKVKERSRQKNTEPSSLPKKIPNAALTMNFCMRPVPLRRMQRISQLKTSIGQTAFWFTTVRNLDRLANQH